MLRCALCVCAVLGFVTAAHAGLAISLVPQTPGPYDPGQTVNVDILAQLTPGTPSVPGPGGTTSLVRVRLMQFDLSDSSPELTFPADQPPHHLTADIGPVGFWDLSGSTGCANDEASCGLNYFIDGNPSDDLLNLTYTGLTSSGSLLVTLNQAAPKRIGELAVVLPDTPGTYVLDVLNDDDADINHGAELRWGFGSTADPTDPTSPLRAFGGGITMVAGQESGLVFVVGSCDDCNDDNQCTADICLNGTCIHVPLDPGTPCGSPASTDCTLPDTCDGQGECLSNHEANDTECTDDGNSCTNDFCLNGECSHPPEPAGTLCVDGNSCTTDDVCNGTGTCAGLPIPDCPGCPLRALVHDEVRRDRILDDLRDYRDNILAQSEEGRRYAGLYYAHADEVTAILGESDSLRLETIVAVLRLLPVVEDLLVGKEAVLSQEDVRLIDRMLGAIQREASDELAQDLQDFREALTKGGNLEALGLSLEDGGRTRIRR